MPLEIQLAILTYKHSFTHATSFGVFKYHLGQPLVYSEIEILKVYRLN